MKRTLFSFALLSAAALLGACGQAPAQARSSAAESASAAAHEKIIEIKDYMFMNLTVPQGTTVTWINRDDVPHTVVEKNKAFRSAALDTDDKFSHLFDKPGVYEYYCSIHPQMVATITVTAK